MNHLNYTGKSDEFVISNQYHAGKATPKETKNFFVSLIPLLPLSQLWCEHTLSRCRASPAKEESRSLTQSFKICFMKNTY